jgi:adenylate cyclase
MSQSRRLAAILAADVVGYSLLMGADEEGTLERLKALRGDLIDPKIAQHHGRLVKTTGDGLLVEFASVIDAVRCAAEVQQAVPEWNTEVPADLRIELRIGINLGDVIADGDDLYGDGVNIAARIEALADAGGVFVSGTVYDQVRDRLPFVFEDRGEQQVKNIARPVRVYRLLLHEVRPTAVGRAPVPLSDKPSIAVLAFHNMSGDPEQEYFSDGVSSDIITELSRNHSLFVISRSSSFTYRGRLIDVRQVSRDLGVRYVVEGSVRRSGNRVRVSAQLVDAEIGNHIWAERYERTLEDVFAVQDEIVEALIDAVSPAVANAEMQRVLRRAPENLGAWETYQRGMWHMSKGTTSEHEQARLLFRRAAELNPGSAAPFVGLALSYHFDVLTYGARSSIDAAQLQHEAARTAVAIDPQDAEAHAVLGMAFLAIGNLGASIGSAEHGLALNRNSALSHAVRCGALIWSGRHEEGRDECSVVLRLDPRSPMAAAALGTVAASFYVERGYSEAIETARRCLTAYPSHAVVRRSLIAALGQLERRGEATIELREFLSAAPDVFAFHINKRPAYVAPAFREHMLNGLRKAGWQG